MVKGENGRAQGPFPWLTLAQGVVALPWVCLPGACSFFSILSSHPPF